MKAQRATIATVTQLPLWPQQQRGLPNAFARSALFNVAQVRKGARKDYKQQVMASLDGINLEYTGEELRQDDEDVFLQILHLARTQPLGEEVRFTAHAMIKALSWSVQSPSYQRLRRSLDRMKATSVTVATKDNSSGYSGSLIRAFAWRDDSGEKLSHWYIQLEPRIVRLFGDNEYSRLDWGVRLSLPPLAKWLHGFYLSHRRPFPMRVETIRKLCGSDMAELRQFRFKLRESLALLVNRGFFTSADINKKSDLVLVERTLDLSTVATYATQ